GGGGGRARKKARWEPSGDQTGVRPAAITGIALPPSEGMTQISGRAASGRRRAKAIRSPSGENDGSSLNAASSVRRIRSPPATRRTYKFTVSPSLAMYAIILPSADRAGERASP